MAGIKTVILKPIHEQERKTANKKASEDTTSRALIRKMVMRNATKNFEKQGFVSITSTNILLPIYNDAYSDEGLNLGANYANKSEKDPEGKQKPVMGQGNYGGWQPTILMMVRLDLARCNRQPIMIHRICKMAR